MCQEPGNDTFGEYHRDTNRPCISVQPEYDGQKTFVAPLLHFSDTDIVSKAAEILLEIRFTRLKMRRRDSRQGYGRLRTIF